MKTPDDFVDVFLWFRICRNLSQFFFLLVHYKELLHQAVIDVEFDHGILNFEWKPPHYIKNTANANDEGYHIVPCNHDRISGICLNEADVEKVGVSCRNVRLVQQLESVETVDFIELKIVFVNVWENCTIVKSYIVLL
jgi:hypothetical protein